MKWFKHQSNASEDSKIAKLEDVAGLAGYAAYFKILELCASNWDEVSEPVFSFSAKQIQQKLHLKENKTEFILNLMSELNLFQVSFKPVSNQLQSSFKVVSNQFQKNKTNYNIIISAPKMAELKKRYQKKDVAETKQRPSYQEKDKDKEKEKEREKEISSSPPSIIETGDIPHPLMLTLTTRFNYPENIVREVAEDAWLKFLVNQDPDKKWDRYLTYYFINEKDSIRNFLINKSKEDSKEKTVDDWMAQINADYEAEQEKHCNQRGGLSDV
jgi:hypothetical protein